MFKLFVVYPFIALVVVWLASDVQVKASPYNFADNYLKLEFPKKQLRPASHPEPYYTLYWNATSTKETLHEINDAVVK